GDYFKARAWLSGFTGSAGTLIVTKNEARLWTDGRYFIQAGKQLSGTGVTLMKMGEEGVPTVENLLRKPCIRRAAWDVTDGPSALPRAESVKNCWLRKKEPLSARTIWQERSGQTALRCQKSRFISWM